MSRNPQGGKAAAPNAKPAVKSASVADKSTDRQPAADAGAKSRWSSEGGKR